MAYATFQLYVVENQVTKNRIEVALGVGVLGFPDVQRPGQEWVLGQYMPLAEQLASQA